LTETNRARATTLVVVVGLFFIAGLLVQVERLNGLSYWTWPWRDLSLGRAVLFMSLPFLPLIWVLRQINGELASKKVGVLLGTLVLINFSMQIAAIAVDPRSLSLVKDIVLSRASTNFYSAALEISSVRDWLAQFHNASLGIHSGTHPPGPILYYYALIRLFGPDHGAIVGGYLVGFTGSLGAIVMYFFSGLWTSDILSRLLACALYVMLPALILFFPIFDQVYPICSMLLILLWIRALNGTGWWSAAFLGVVLFVSTMLAYGLLTIGAFLAMYALLLLLRDGKDHTHGWRIIECGMLSLGVFVALHFALWLITGYNAFYSWQSSEFRAALIDARYFANYVRPYSRYSRIIIFGPYDFFLGAGMLAFPLLALYVSRVVRDFNKERSHIVLSVLGLATILIVDLTGLLPSETARLWLFMQPLIVVPVALELRAFAPSNRLIIFIVQWVILAVMKCKLAFIVP
jgi:hypothetical protein